MPPAKKAKPEQVNFSAKLTPRAKAYLDALASMMHKSAYSVLEDAFWFYWESLPSDLLPKEKRDLVAGFAEATLKGK